MTGYIVAIPSTVFLAFGVIQGLTTDKFGKKGHLLTIGFALMFIAHIIFLSFDICPSEERCYEGIFPMILIGFANTMVQLTLYPSVNYLVKEKYFGTAYGIIESATNIGMFVGSLLIGDILNTNYAESKHVDIEQYHWVHIMLIIISFVSFLTSLKLN